MPADKNTLIIVNGPPFEKFMFKCAIFGNQEPLTFTVTKSEDGSVLESWKIQISIDTIGKHPRDHVGRKVSDKTSYEFQGYYLKMKNTGRNQVPKWFPYYYIGTYDPSNRSGKMIELPEADFLEAKTNKVLIGMVEDFRNLTRIFNGSRRRGF